MSSTHNGPPKILTMNKQPCVDHATQSKRKVLETFPELFPSPFPVNVASPMTRRRSVLRWWHRHKFNSYLCEVHLSYAHGLFLLTLSPRKSSLGPAAPLNALMSIQRWNTRATPFTFLAISILLSDVLQGQFSVTSFGGFIHWGCPAFVKLQKFCLYTLDNFRAERALSPHSHRASSYRSLVAALVGARLYLEGKANIVLQ